MRERLHVLAAAVVLLTVCLACRGGRAGLEDAGAAPVASATTTTAATGCTEATKEVHGSLHAEVAFEAATSPPKSKHRQAFECDGVPAVALYMDYDDEKAVWNAASLIGASMWGRDAPTSENPDQLMTKESTLVIVSGTAISPLVKKLEKSAFATWRPQAVDGESLADDLKAAIDCTPQTHDPLRGWCVVADEPSSAFSLPDKTATYVGVTVAVKTGQSLKEAFQNVSISALSVGDGRILLQGVTPDNDAEKRSLAALAALVQKVLGADAHGPIKVGPGLAKFLDGLKRDLPTRGHPIDDSIGPALFTAKNPSEVAIVQSVGSAYVVLERAPNGTWINVFPVVDYVP